MSKPFPNRCWPWRHEDDSDPEALAERGRRGEGSLQREAAERVLREDAEVLRGLAAAPDPQDARVALAIRLAASADNTDEAFVRCWWPLASKQGVRGYWERAADAAQAHADAQTAELQADLRTAERRRLLARDRAREAVAQTDALRAEVERLRAVLAGVLAHDWAEDCQECAIGLSDAWKAARSALEGGLPSTEPEIRCPRCNTEVGVMGACAHPECPCPIGVEGGR